MTAELDELLERCLEAHAQGEAVESLLAEVRPELRREIEPLIILGSLLRSAPRPALPTATSAFQEHRLLAHTAELRAGGAVRQRRASTDGGWAWLAFLKGQRLGLVPAATVFLLVASLVLAGSAGAMVSNARPDDALYTFKLSWEQTQLLLSSNDAQRARVFIGIAQSRLREVELLAQDGQPVPEELLQQVKLAVSQSIVLASSLTGRDAIPILRELSELLSYERLLLGRFLASMPQPERATVELALQDVDQSQQAVTQALQGRVEEQTPAATVTSAPAVPTATLAPQPAPTAAASDAAGSAAYYPAPLSHPGPSIGPDSLLVPTPEPPPGDSGDPAEPDSTLDGTRSDESSSQTSVAGSSENASPDRPNARSGEGGRSKSESRPSDDERRPSSGDQSSNTSVSGDAAPGAEGRDSHDLTAGQEQGDSGSPEGSPPGPPGHGDAVPPSQVDGEGHPGNASGQEQGHGGGQGGSHDESGGSGPGKNGAGGSKKDDSAEQGDQGSGNKDDSGGSRKDDSGGGKKDGSGGKRDEPGGKKDDGGGKKDDGKEKSNGALREALSLVVTL